MIMPNVKSDLKSIAEHLSSKASYANALLFEISHP